MRHWLTAGVLLVVALAGYALAPGAIRAQSPSTPFTPGQVLILTFEPGRLQHRCIVTLQHGDFIGCTRERVPGSDERETWYNLRFVQRVERRER